VRAVCSAVINAAAGPYRSCRASNALNRTRIELAPIDGRRDLRDVKKTIDRCLRRSNRILHGEDNVIRQFAKLARKCKIYGSLRHDLRLER